MKFFIADAFTETVFGGNTAGIVLLEDTADFPSPNTMTKVAAELRYSETAFIKQLSENAFHIRYFTPAEEVALCGHATIAAFKVLLDCGIVQDHKDYTSHTLAGKLTIKLQDRFVMMEMAKPEVLEKIEESQALQELYSCLGISYEKIIVQQSCSQYVDLKPMIISTGLPDIILPVKNRKLLKAINPDFSALSLLSEKYHVTGVHAFTLDRADFDITAHCRNFAPICGINEESATGTANGALTYYLFGQGLISNEKESVFLQGEAMNRPSKILTYLCANEQNMVQIQVGGNAAVLAKGELYI